MSLNFRVGLIQMKCEENPACNLTKCDGMIEEAAARGASVVCLQELFRTSYFPQEVNPSYYALAETFPGPTTRWLQDVARKYRVVLIGSIFEEITRGLAYNTAVVVNEFGEILGKARKNHIPDGAGYHEKYYFVQGDSGYPVFKTSFCQLGIATCWDQWFPEAARIMALKGAQLILYPTAIGSEPCNPDLETRESWQLVMRSHAIVNELYVGAVNRVGVEKSISFFGSSFLANPFGKLVAEGGFEDEVIVAQVDLGLIQKARDAQHFFRDRRIDTYGELLQKWIA